MNFINWIIGNPTITVPIAVVVLGAVAMRWRYVRSIVRIAQAAYRIAEEEGILKGLKGAEKAAPFLTAFFDKWAEKYGSTTPPPSVQAMAIKVAAASAAADNEGKS